MAGTWWWQARAGRRRIGSRVPTFVPFSLEICCFGHTLTLFVVKNSSCIRLLCTVTDAIHGAYPNFKYQFCIRRLPSVIPHCCRQTPVCAPEGHVFEVNNIVAWIKRHHTVSPAVTDDDFGRSSSNLG